VVVYPSEKSYYHQIRPENLISHSLLKPLHEYARRMSPEPKEVSPKRYNQEAYSEYLIRFADDGHITMMSRPAIQQFISVKSHSFKVPDDCFPDLFAFYCSWFIDTDADVEIIEPDTEDYPFRIAEKVVLNFKQRYSEPRTDLIPVWIPFFVKKDNKYMKPLYGKIEKHTPIYDMVIK
jgi:hypothetical protein